MRPVPHKRRWPKPAVDGQLGSREGRTNHLRLVDLVRGDSERERDTEDGHVPPLGHFLVLAHESVVYVVVREARLEENEQSAPFGVVRTFLRWNTARTPLITSVR